jgi:signal peptidase II
MSKWPGISFYVTMALAAGLDQVTKAWATAWLEPVEYYSLVPGFFSLSYRTNTGIAFGLFEDEGWLVALFVLVLVLAAIYYTRGLSWVGWETNVVGGLLCGGALGNLLDRCRLGYVVDFFDAHISAWHLEWPVFNVADSLICVAVGWIVARQFLGGKKQ